MCGLRSFGVYALFLCFVNVHGQIISRGICPKLNGMPNFKLSRYVGNWYEVERYFFALQATVKCQTIHYSTHAHHDPTKFEVEVSHLERLSRFYLINNATISFVKNNSTADLKLHFRINQLNHFTPVGLTVSVPYLILDTDYYNYAIKYMCLKLGKRRIQAVWIISRNPAMYFSSSARKRVHGMLKQWDLKPEELLLSGNRNCDAGRGVF